MYAYYSSEVGDSPISKMGTLISFVLQSSDDHVKQIANYCILLQTVTSTTIQNLAVVFRDDHMRN